MVDQSRSLRRIQPVDQQELRMAKMRFQVELQEDRRQRVSKTGTYIEAMIAAGNTGEEWINIKRWYRHAKGNP